MNKAIKNIIRDQNIAWPDQVVRVFSSFVVWSMRYIENPINKLPSVYTYKLTTDEIMLFEIFEIMLFVFTIFIQQYINSFYIWSYNKAIHLKTCRSRSFGWYLYHSLFELILNLEQRNSFWFIFNRWEYYLQLYYNLNWSYHCYYFVYDVEE